MKLPLEQYLKVDLFEELGLVNLTPEERTRWLEAFGNVLQLRLTHRLMQELPEGAKDKFNEVLEKTPGDDVVVAQVLTAALPNFQEMAEEEVANYKKELIQRMKV